MNKKFNKIDNKLIIKYKNVRTKLYKQKTNKYKRKKKKKPK